MRKSVYPHPVNLPNLFYTGEAFSDIQGWIEGSLSTSNLGLSTFYAVKEQKYIFKPIVDINVIDPHTVMITLDQARPDFLFNIGLGDAVIVNKDFAPHQKLNTTLIKVTSRARAVI